MSAPRVIAFANQKGGVGKTTTAVNLAACLAERGQDILVIDFDPQANATSALGIEKQPGHSVYAALLGESTLQEEIIGTAVKRLDLIPSELDLAGAEVDIARSEHYLHCFQKALAPLLAEDRYDYIFIDCPPSLGILTSNALTAAHALIIPVQCEYLALEGLSMITRMIEQLRAGGANPGLTLDGIVMTMFDGRTRLALQVIEEVKKHFGERVYETFIPRTVRLSEAPSFGQPIMLYDPRGTGALAYQTLAKEFLRRHRKTDDGPDKEDDRRRTTDARPEKTDTEGRIPDDGRRTADGGPDQEDDRRRTADGGPEKTDTEGRIPDDGQRTTDDGPDKEDDRRRTTDARPEKTDTEEDDGSRTPEAGPEKTDTGGRTPDDGHQGSEDKIDD